LKILDGVSGVLPYYINCLDNLRAIMIDCNTTDIIISGGLYWAESHIAWSGSHCRL